LIKIKTKVKDKEGQLAAVPLHSVIFRERWGWAVCLSVGFFIMRCKEGREGGRERGREGRKSFDMIYTDRKEVVKLMRVRGSVR
jgi:hypothetical protein